MSTKKGFFLSIVSLLLVGGLSGQRYFTEEANIQFFSKTPVEDIKAESDEGRCVIDSETGEMQWDVDVRTFDFRKELMEEHFNENYIESHKYPKGKFAGQIVSGDVDWQNDGVYDITVSGTMEMHGVSQEHTADATITIDNGQVSANSVFFILLEDYKIKRPKIVIKNIAESIEVTVNAKLSPLSEN